MGRRKKELASAHRANIAIAAGQLFGEKGIKETTMDEIAKAAGYSKATVYVYFENKEEIVGILALESMRKLEEYISLALSKHGETRVRYEAVCHALLQYQEEFPCYFQIVLQELNVELEREDALPVEKEIFEVGEQINEKLSGFLQSGINEGNIRSDIRILPTVFSFWAMLSGLLQMAREKERYIQKAFGMEKQDFLKSGFDLLYRSILAGEARE